MGLNGLFATVCSWCIGATSFAIVLRSTRSRFWNSMGGNDLGCKAECHG